MTGLGGVGFLRGRVGGGARVCEHFLGLKLKWEDWIGHGDGKDEGYEEVATRYYYLEGGFVMILVLESGGAGDVRVLGDTNTQLCR